MKRSEFVEILAARAQLGRARADELLTTLFAEMESGLKKTGGIELRGFGSFRCSKLRHRSAVNPFTKDPLKIPTRNVVRFRMSKELTTLLQGSPLPEATP